MHTDTHQIEWRQTRSRHRNLIVLLLLAALNLGADEKNKYSKRFGKLLITVTAIETPKTVRAFGEEGTEVEPRVTYRFLVVRVRVKNLSTNRGVREWLLPVLRTSFGLEYQPTLRVAGVGLYQRDIYELLPGEQVEGGYIFEVKEGAVPDQITFKRVSFQRAVEKKVRISLQGLPVEGRQQP